MIIAAQMFLNNPIVGVGYSNYENNYQTYNDLLGLDNRFGYREPHDLFLEILAETGVLGFIPFVIATIALFISLGRAKKQLISLGREDLVIALASVEISIITFLTTSVFLHGAYIRYLWLFWAFAAGGVVLAEILTRKQNEVLKRREDDLYMIGEMISL